MLIVADRVEAVRSCGQLIDDVAGGVDGIDVVAGETAHRVVVSAAREGIGAAVAGENVDTPVAGQNVRACATDRVFDAAKGHHRADRGGAREQIDGCHQRHRRGIDRIDPSDCRVGVLIDLVGPT